MRYAPMTFAALWDMPNGEAFANSNAYKAFMWASVITQEKVSNNVFVFDDTSASDFRRNEALFEYAAEAQELQASLQSAFALSGEQPEPTVAITTDPPCQRYKGRPHDNFRKPWQGAVNCGVFGHAWRENSSFFCAHVVAVNPQPTPALATFEVDGLPSSAADLGASCLSNGPGQPAVSASCVQRLFDQVYALNATHEAGRFTFRDIVAGASSAVYRIGCTPPPLADELASVVHDGDFEHDIDLGIPGKLATNPGTEGLGQTLYPSVGSPSGWRLLHGTRPPLARPPSAPFLPALGLF